MQFIDDYKQTITVGATLNNKVTLRAAPKRLHGYPFSATGIIHGLVQKLYIKRDKW